MAERLRAAVLEHPGPRYKLLFFDPKPGEDLRDAAQREALKWVKGEFTVYTVLPEGVSGIEYVDRANAGLSTTLCRDADGNHYYVDWSRKPDDPYSLPVARKGEPA